MFALPHTKHFLRTLQRLPLSTPALPRTFNRKYTPLSFLSSKQPQRLPTPSFTRFYSANVHSREKGYGPIPLPGVIIFLLTVAGLGWYFTEEKKRLVAEKEAARLSANASIGKPKVGGPFKLIDTEGKTVTNEDFFGQYFLMYFGFTHCPDICPEELDKMAQVVDLLRANPDIGKIITPIFVTCDPRRDGIAEVKEYVEQFHPDLVGLTGDIEEIARLAKSYRMYFSSPPNVAPGEDYLVDHSIFFYFMDPHGKFIDAYGRDWTAGQVVRNMEEHIRNYREAGGKEGREAILKEHREKKATIAANTEKEGMQRTRNTN